MHLRSLESNSCSSLMLSKLPAGDHKLIYAYMLGMNQFLILKIQPFKLMLLVVHSCGAPFKVNPFQL